MAFRSNKSVIDYHDGCLRTYPEKGRSVLCDKWINDGDKQRVAHRASGVRLSQRGLS